MLLPQDPSEGGATPLHRLQGRERGATSARRSESPGRRLGAWQVAGDLPASFRYAAQGLAYGFLSQRNFRIHVVTGAVVFSMGLWLGLSPDRLAVLVLTVAAVLVLELLNTATEAVVDLAIGRRFHPLARIAKDCAAAAVLVAALASLLIAGLLLVPPLLIRLGH
ncbi:diacylglycerol kinase family protein [Cyanobium sp. FGCU-6]|nr:diacylglycerol kinase family protein [Cyanobium sp. FGCU6]